jgi:histidinol dehydrogenase/sulfopropanediol 3-dehydrogenase
MKFLKRPESGPFADYTVSAEIQDIVKNIVSKVKQDGDEAVRQFTEKFDDVARDSNVLQPAERETALDRVSSKERHIIDNSIKNIRQFAELQLSHVEEFEEEVRDGVTLGQRIVPIESVGAYVPGGGYPLLSSPLMSVIPADVAGVETISVAMPPQNDGVPHPAAVYGAIQAGATEIYVIGGAQAIAALAIGTETVSAVDKIVGPGNAFVTEAKKQVYGSVGIDLLAGPSEILVIADETADTEIVAADLLAQAEHDTAARPLLVTTSERVGNAVISEVTEQLTTLSTAEIAGESWEIMGAVIVVTDLSEAADVSDELAPEHLEIQVEQPQQVLDQVSNYGTAFLGENSANVFSDKLIGTNHILPTQRASRYTAGLSVHEFVKYQTHQEVSDEAVTELEPWATAQSVVEHLEGHAKSSYIRSPGKELSEYETDDHAPPEE